MVRRPIYACVQQPSTGASPKRTDSTSYNCQEALRSLRSLLIRRGGWGAPVGATEHHERTGAGRRSPYAAAGHVGLPRTLASLRCSRRSATSQLGSRNEKCEDAKTITFSRAKRISSEEGNAAC
jgi:hypothetical protein